MHPSFELRPSDNTDMFVNGYFMLISDLTPDQGASDDHTSHPEQGNIRVELKFAKPLPEAIT